MKLTYNHDLTYLEIVDGAYPHNLIRIGGRGSQTIQFGIMPKDLMWVASALVGCPLIRVPELESWKRMDSHITLRDLMDNAYKQAQHPRIAELEKEISKLTDELTKLKKEQGG